jgi:hypothetical protein
MLFSASEATEAQASAGVSSQLTVQPSVVIVVLQALTTKAIAIAIAGRRARVGVIVVLAARDVMLTEPAPVTCHSSLSNDRRLSRNRVHIHQIVHVYPGAWLRWRRIVVDCIHLGPPETGLQIRCADRDLLEHRAERLFGHGEIASDSCTQAASVNVTRGTVG